MAEHLRKTGDKKRWTYWLAQRINFELRDNCVRIFKINTRTLLTNLQLINLFELLFLSFEKKLFISLIQKCIYVYDGRCSLRFQNMCRNLHQIIYFFPPFRDKMYLILLVFQKKKKKNSLGKSILPYTFLRLNIHYLIFANVYVCESRRPFYFWGFRMWKNKSQ